VAPAGAGAMSRAGARARSCSAESPGCAERAHLIVLLAPLGVSKYLMRFGDLLEAIGGFRVVGILVRMVPGRELSVLLFDLVLCCRRRYTENRVKVFVLRHGAQYVLSRSTASRRHALAGAVDR